jgi:hypothetical protein
MRADAMRNIPTHFEISRHTLEDMINAAPGISPNIVPPILAELKAKFDTMPASIGASVYPSKRALDCRIYGRKKIGDVDRSQILVKLDPAKTTCADQLNWLTAVFSKVLRDREVGLVVSPIEKYLFAGYPDKGREQSAYGSASYSDVAMLAALDGVRNGVFEKVPQLGHVVDFAIPVRQWENTAMVDLAHLAKDFGGEIDWELIWQINALAVQDPDHLPAGQTILIPIVRKGWHPIREIADNWNRSDFAVHYAQEVYGSPTMAKVVQQYRDIYPSDAAPPSEFYLPEYDMDDVDTVWSGPVLIRN